jgi:hypothetical protein
VSALETAYENGQLAALQKLGLAQPSLGSVGISTPVKTPGTPSAASLPKLPMPELNTTPGPSLGQRAAKVAFPAPTHAAVKGSPVLGGNPPSPVQIAPNATTPETVKSVFDVHEQSKTRLEPVKKLGADICTSCRKPTHYGPCLKPVRTRPAGVPVKRANFNFGMKGEDAVSERPATSSRYNASVVDGEIRRSFGKLSPAVQNTETVSIDQLGTAPVGEPDVHG